LKDDPENGAVLGILKSMFARHVIVLPENWTGGLDGESEGTIIPSREIYETTT
jgi:hypothetical protein